MTIQDYFSGVAIGAMVGLLTAGVPTLAAALRRDGSDSLGPREPSFSIGLIMTYLPVVYVGGGIIAIVVRGSDPVLNASLLLLTAVAAHIVYVASHRRSALPTDVGRVAGLTDLFESGTSDILRRCCREDLTRMKKVRLVAPNLAELFAPGVAIGEALSEAVGRGIKLEALTDGRISSPSDLGLRSAQGAVEVLGIDPADTSGHWLILSTGNVVYFGLLAGGSQLSEVPIFRGVASDTDNAGHIVDAVLSVLDGLFERARRGDFFSRVTTAASPTTYRERLGDAEAGARAIDRIPKRLSVVFRGEETIRSIAEQRFGRGSPFVREYFEEHRDRREEFYIALARGMVCRELYNESELVQYVKSRMHGISVKLEASEIADTLRRWREAIDTHQNYLVAVTNDPIPFKYVLIDGRIVILHEAIGISDLYRLNSISLEGRAVGKAFLSDFQTVWERVPPDRRSRRWLLQFIDHVLMPLAIDPDETRTERGA